MRRLLLPLMFVTALFANAQTTPIFVFQGFGDSYVVGSGAITPTLGGGFAQLARTIPSVPAANFGVTGANSDAINLAVWTKVQPSPQVPSAYLLDGGANDGACGTSAGCLANFQEELSASIARLAIPNQERTWASACTQTAGTWTADNGAPYVIPAPTYYLNPGTAMSATGTGSILTCVVNSRAPSSKVGIDFQVTNAQTGTFTVTVDGLPATFDMCSGTTTFSSGPCNGVSLLTNATAIFRQKFGGILGKTHTVVITTTNASKVDVTAVDTVPSTPQPNSNYVIVFGPNAAFTNSALYDAAVESVVKPFVGEGARVVFADLQSAANPGPGVNATTDIAQTATAFCTASANANHPNDICGWYHFAQTIANATATWNIFGTPQGLGGGSTFSMTGVLLSTTAIASGTCAVIPGSAWNVAGVTHLTKVTNGWSGDPGGTAGTGMLTIITAPTDSGTVVGRICNPSAASITPTNQAINWWITP